MYVNKYNSSLTYNTGKLEVPRNGRNIVWYGYMVNYNKLILLSISDYSSPLNRMRSNQANVSTILSVGEIHYTNHRESDLFYF